MSNKHHPAKTPEISEGAPDPDRGSRATTTFYVRMLICGDSGRVDDPRSPVYYIDQRSGWTSRQRLATPFRDFETAQQRARGLGRTFDVAAAQ